MLATYLPAGISRMSTKNLILNIVCGPKHKLILVHSSKLSRQNKIQKRQPCACNFLQVRATQFNFPQIKFKLSKLKGIKNQIFTCKPTNVLLKL